MALFIGYAETKLPDGILRRFLLDLDLTVLGTDAEPGPGAPVNIIDLDGTSPQAQPQLAIAVILRRFAGSERLLEFRLRPLPGQTIVEAEIGIWVIDFVGGVFPLNGPPPPDPATFIHVGYRGEPGQAMPELLKAFLGRNVLGTPADHPLSETSIALVTTPAAQPLHFAFGQVAGTPMLAQARTTSFVGGVYTEGPLVDVRAIDPAAAPDAMFGDVTISDPAAVVLDATSIGARIRSPRGGDRPLGTPAAALLNGPGGVDRGGHRYKVTYLLANQNESGGSDPSPVVTVTDPASDGRARLTGIPIGPPLATGEDPLLAVVGRRVYRTIASADGDTGEYFRVGEILDNQQTSFDDTTADAAAVEPLPARLEVDACASRPVRVAAVLRLRDRGVEDVYDAAVSNLPADVRVVYRSAGATDPGPRLTWHSIDVVRALELRLPELRSETRWAEARAREVPKQLGVHWLLRGEDRARFVVGGRTLLELAEPIADLALLMASAERTWRDAPQTICFEQVTRRRADGTLERSRTRIGARGLRRFELELGAAGTHSRDGDGLIGELLIGVDPGPPGAKAPLRDRCLRLLRVVDRPGPAGRDHTHLWVRAGVLPDRLALDLRATSDPAAPENDYLGLHFEGAVRRLKALAMTDPSRFTAPFEADGQRVWLAVADTGEQVDLLRALAAPGAPPPGPEGRSDVETFLGLAHEAFVELSIRNPRGIGSGDDPLRAIEAAVVLPREVRLGTPRPVRTFGFAAAGSTETEIRDAIAAHPADAVGGAIRFVTGALAGERRTITSVAAAGESLATDPFPTAPAAGDRYALEAAESGPAPASAAGVTLRPGSAAQPGVVSGRIAASRLGPLVAVRATPQIGLRRAVARGETELKVVGVTARVLGVRDLALTIAADRETVLRAALDPARLNRAFRAGIRDLDDRFSTLDRVMARIRLVVLPDTLQAALIDTERGVYELAVPPELEVGPLLFRAEPGMVADKGPRLGMRAGIGLIDGRVLAIPHALRVWQIGVATPRLPETERRPRNWTPPSSWQPGGVKLETSERIDLHSLRLIRWERDNPADSFEHVWSRYDVRQLVLEQLDPAPPGSPPRLDPMWLWSVSEPPPSDGDDPDSGLGYRFAAALRMTLDLDAAEQKTDRTSAWNDLGGLFTLKQEFQMKDYRGEVSVSKDIGLGEMYHKGDMDAGPGLWFLRVLNALIPPVGASSAFFGNTGGLINSRPRIFA